MGSRKTRPKKHGMKAPVEGLTDLQSLFVQEYCVDLNASKAGVRAGAAVSYGAKQMAQPLVVEAIRRQLGKRAQETEIDAQKVLYELALVAFSDPGHLFDENGSLLHIRDMPEGIRKSLASCEVQTRESRDGSTVTVAKIKFYNKLEALSLIGKHLGILGSTVENKHLHLHSAATNPYLNAPDDLVLQAKDALAMLEHSVKGNIVEVED